MALLSEPSKKSLGTQLITFYLNQEIYGINVLEIQSIERMSTITRIPNSEEYVIGVINLRGDIIPVVNSRKKLGMKDKLYDSDTRIIITHLGDYQVGIVVDEILEVLTISDNEIHFNADLLKEVGQEFIEGVINLKERIILILNLEKFLGI